jgi:hypothetical protein
MIPFVPKRMDLHRWNQNTYLSVESKYIFVQCLGIDAIVPSASDGTCCNGVILLLIILQLVQNILDMMSEFIQNKKGGILIMCVMDRNKIVILVIILFQIESTPDTTYNTLSNCVVVDVSGMVSICYTTSDSILSTLLLWSRTDIKSVSIQ